MNSVVLVGAELVASAAARMERAAADMHGVAARFEAAFEQRRRWEEEYLSRIEAVVDRELAFYGEKQG